MEPGELAWRAMGVLFSLTNHHSVEKGLTWSLATRAQIDGWRSWLMTWPA